MNSMGNSRILEFNCFRSGTVITEPFDKDKYDTVLRKFGEQPDRIADNESWHPSLEFLNAGICAVKMQCVSIIKQTRGCKDQSVRHNMY